jgi:TamB, inner membrane protein subunit of TAM complex
MDINELPMLEPDLPESTAPEMEAEGDRVVRRSLFGRIWAGFGRLVRTLLLIFFVGYLILQLPFVQNAIRDGITSYLSDAWKMEVKAERMYIDYYNVIVLQQFTVADLNQDTLLHTGLLRVEFGFSPLEWMQNRFYVHKATLDGGRLILRRPAGDTTFNYQPILDWLTPDKQTKKTGKTQVMIDYVGVTNLSVERNDLLKGKLLKAEVGEFLVKLKNIDLLKNQFHIAELRGDRIAVHLYTILGDRGALPPDEDVITEIIDEIQESDTTKLPLVIKIDQIDLKNCGFSLDNFVKTPVRVVADSLMDFTHMQVSNIKLQLDSLVFAEQELTGRLRHMSADEKGGFKLVKLTSKTFSVGQNKVELAGMLLETPYSKIGDTLKLKYGSFVDFNSFTEDVALDLRMKNGSVRLSDIVFFAPKLAQNPFFAQNYSRNVSIDGRVYGTVNSLNGKALTISLGTDTYVKANFSTQELINPDETILDIKFDRLNTSISTLQKLLPNFRPPPLIERLGDISLGQASVSGFYHDLVISGDLRSDLGRADLSTRFDLKNGRSDIRLSGKMEMKQFDLGRLLNAKGLGIVSLNANLTEARIRDQGRFSGKIALDADQITVANYSYKNIHFDGLIEDKVLDGRLVLGDPNADLLFTGKIDIGAQKRYKFQAQINNLQLDALGLVKSKLGITGLVDANVTGSDLKTLQGSFEGHGLKVTNATAQNLLLDSLIVSLNDVNATNRRLLFKSDLGSLEAEGDFRLDQFVNAWTNYLVKHYPVYATDLGVRAHQTINEPYFFAFNSRFNESKNWTAFIDPKFTLLRGLQLDGFARNGFADDAFELDLHAHELAYDRYRVEELHFFADSERSKGSYKIDIFKSHIGDSTHFESLTLQGIVDTQQIGFQLTSANALKELDFVDLSGQIKHEGRFYRFTFDNSTVTVMNDKWNVPSGNYMLLSRDSLRTNQFKIEQQNGGRSIELTSRNALGLDLKVHNMDLSLISPLIKFDKIQLSGPFDLNVSTSNIMKMDNLELDLLAEETLINKDKSGILEVHATALSLKDPFEGLLTLVQKGDHSLLAEFTYLPPTMGVESAKAYRLKPGNVFVNIEANELPVKYINYIITTGISGVEGRATGRLKVSGNPKKLDFDGLINLYKTAVTIDYTKVRYFVDSAEVVINNYEISADNQTLRDEAGRTATIIGGLTHNHFKQFGVDCQILTDGFQALNTTSEDNKLFYGTAVAAGFIGFTGDFQRTNIQIVVSSLEGTEISLPFIDEEKAGANNFVRFIDSSKDTVKAETAGSAPLGVSISMDLDITEDAKIKLIFDEQAGDVIDGTGSGNLRIKLSRSGEFTMSGRYTIKKGNYLFTLMNVVNKPFEVQPGGTITWTGDPLGAIIKLDADYKELKTSPYNFIQEYLVTDADRIAASQSTPVDLSLHMEGPFLTPEITFKIGFPNLTGTIKSYTDSKLNIALQDPNELNRQVFGLVVINGFLPSSQALSGNTSIGAINTVSEMITSQLSLLINEYLGQYTQGLNIDVDYNRYQLENLNNSGANATVGEQFNLSIKYDNLFNNRVAVSGGVGIGNNTLATEGPGTFVGGDVLVELFISKDRRLKLTAYNINDQTFNGSRRNRAGGGIAYKQEFDSFQEFVQEIRVKKKKQ